MDQVVEQILGVGGAGRNGDDSKCGRLPGIVKIHFGSGNIELFVQSGDQRFEDAALLLERRQSRQIQFNRTGTDNHVAYSNIPVTAQGTEPLRIFKLFPMYFLNLEPMPEFPYFCYARVLSAFLQHGLCHIPKVLLQHKNVQIHLN